MGMVTQWGTKAITTPDFVHRGGGTVEGPKTAVNWGFVGPDISVI